MAKIVDPSASYMSLPMGIARGNPTPIDKTLVWTNEAEMRAYAANQSETSLSYVGQILTLVESGKTQAFVIKDVNGNLEKMPFESEISGSIGPITGDVGALSRKITALCGTVDSLATQVGEHESDIEVLQSGKIGTDKIVTALNASSTDDTIPGAKTTYEFVNSSITNMAAFYLCKNAAGDAFDTKAELDAAIASGNFYNGGKKVTPKKNDYTIVQADESHVSGSNPTTRYIFDGSSWAFQYVVNNTTFTEAQLKALNSGVTDTLLCSITASVASLSDSVIQTGIGINELSGKAANTDSALELKIQTLSGNIENILPVIENLQRAIMSITGTYLDRFFTEDDTVVEPSIASYPTNSVTLTNGNGGEVAGEIEVGQTFTPYYSISLTDGSFTCAGKTQTAGCTANTYTVTDSTGATGSAQSGTVHAAFVVGDGSKDTGGTTVGIANYRLSAKTKYNQSDKAKNSKGEETSLVIETGTTATVSSTTVTGVRYMFWGMDDGTGDVTSAVIRGLGTFDPTHQKKPEAGVLPTLEASSRANAKRCIVAIPATSELNLTKVTMPVTLDIPITSEFKLQSLIKVEGYGGYPAIDYKVWVYRPAVLDPVENYSITIA